MSFLAAALFFVSAAACPVEPSRITDIVIQTDRTEHDVVRRELHSRPCETFSPALLNADVKRLKNLGIFWSVDATAVTEATGARLHLNIRDKWTLQPRLRFNTTADILEWQVGLYDANLLGYFTEIGAQVEQKAGAYGFLFWHYNWSLRYTDAYYKIEAGQRRLFRYVYDQNLSGDQLEGVYESTDNNLMLEFGSRIGGSAEHLLGIVFHPGDVSYNPSSASQLHREANAASGFRGPESRRYFDAGLRLQWDRPQEDDYIYSGSGANALVLARLGGVTELASVRASVEYKWLTELFRRHNAGFRVFAGRTNSTRLDDVFTMGGLTEVRGFPDERFYGQNVWYANAEYRIPVMDNRWLLVQPTVFSDAGKAWNGNLFDGEAVRRLALTAGTGIRFYVKPGFNTSLRIDYGWAIEPFHDSGLSIGINQFF
jgi:outer membrane protein assembly factor BamA